MKNRWIHIFMIAAVLAAGLPGGWASAQNTRGRRASDSTRNRQRTSDSSQYAQGSAGTADYSNLTGFAAFGLLEQRNIFDSRRRGIPTAPPPTAPITTAPIAESVSLLGVLLDKSDAVAFFEGSNAEYNASVKLGGIIAGHKLVEIRTDKVVLASPSRKVELPVAFQMSHRSGGDWEVTTPTVAMESMPVMPMPTYSAQSYSTRQSNSRSMNTREGGNRRGGRNNFASEGMMMQYPGAMNPAMGNVQGMGAAPATVTAPATGSAATATSGASADEILKRLMERRRKEIGQ